MNEYEIRFTLANISNKIKLKLLQMYNNEENIYNNTDEILAKTIEFSKFKAAGTEGILNCKIASLILPLLADHVLREANHYIRLLQIDNMKS